jgi:hypothetical protein
MNDQIHKKNRTKGEMARDKIDYNIKRMASIQSLSSLDKGNFLGLWDR